MAWLVGLIKYHDGPHYAWLHPVHKQAPSTPPSQSWCWAFATASLRRWVSVICLSAKRTHVLLPYALLPHARMPRADGTHYSAPAFVAFYLLRQAPELTLHLPCKIRSTGQSNAWS